jgi:outer membrane protein OmpA-like peptidoglycan-associated protein
MASPARPRTLTVEFKAGSAALTPAAKSELTKLSKELVRGASITVTGYAKGNAKLAKGRASAVADYLKAKAHATVKSVTTSGANTATVVTTKQ